MEMVSDWYWADTGVVEWYLTQADVSSSWVPSDYTGFLTSDGFRIRPADEYIVVPSDFTPSDATEYLTSDGFTLSVV